MRFITRIGESSSSGYIQLLHLYFLKQEATKENYQTWYFTGES